MILHIIDALKPKWRLVRQPKGFLYLYIKKNLLRDHGSLSSSLQCFQYIASAGDLVALVKGFFSSLSIKKCKLKSFKDLIEKTISGMNRN